MFVSAAAADRSSIHRCLVKISRRTGLRLGLWQCRRHKASFHIRPFEVSSCDNRNKHSLQNAPNTINAVALLTSAVA
ncbi:hypothetical protein KCU81_g269, partial [Aureobasidium melanogenum]